MAKRTDLDRSDALPLWAQLLQRLRARIDAGEFSERFPTDQELVDQYGVSRHTVREAVRRIQAEGLLVRRRGRGSELTSSFEQPVGAIYSLYRSIESTGTEQTSVVLVQDVRTEQDVAERLDLPDDTEFFYLERLRLAGDSVLAQDRIWLPLEIAKPLVDADFRRTAVYDELRDRVGIRPESGRESIRAVIPTDAEREALGLEPHESAFLIRRHTFHDGQPLEWRITLARADRYEFVVNWTPDGPVVPNAHTD